MLNYQKFIGINPEIRFGKPCIKGTRITVYDVLAWLSKGMSEKDIIADYPALTIEQIRACLAYAAHKERKVTIFAA